jgi:hypothetical protein
MHKMNFWFSRLSLAISHLHWVWDAQVLHDCVLQKVKQNTGWHNKNSMLVFKTSRSHIFTSNHQCHTTYQLGVDFIETNQSLFRPLNLSRISTLAHAPLELGNDQIHLFRVASASGREGTKARVGADTAQARGAVDAS